MVGRGVVKGGPFGDRPDGYEADFFEGVTVEVVDARGAKDTVAGKAKLIGKAPGHQMGGMQMGADMHGEGHQGFMIQLEPGGVATIAFTVPEGRAGRWEMGCFSEDGQHYGEGMKGTWEVKG